MHFLPIFWIELMAVLTMLVGVIGMVRNRANNHQGIGVGSVQFASITLVVPAVLILALEEKIQSEVAGTLFAALIGYVLANVSKDGASR